MEKERKGRKGKKEKGMKGRRKGLSPRKNSIAATASNRGNCQLNVCYCLKGTEKLEAEYLCLLTVNK